MSILPIFSGRPPIASPIGTVPPPGASGSSPIAPPIGRPPGLSAGAPPLLPAAIFDEFWANLNKSLIQQNTESKTESKTEEKKEEPKPPVVGQSVVNEDGSVTHTNTLSDGTVKTSKTYNKDGKQYFENEDGTFELVDTPAADGNGFTREYINVETGEKRSEKWTPGPDGASWSVDNNGDGKTDATLLNTTVADANLRQRALNFDADYYLAQNPDVAAAVARGETTAERHWAEYGQKEGRNPNAVFNTQKYLQDNPDVAAAVQRGETTAFQHYSQYGFSEGRKPF